MLLNPTLTVYYDYDEGNGAFITAALSHTFALPKDLRLKLGGLVSYNIENGIMGFDDNGDKFSNFYNAELNAALTIPITKLISVTPKAAYSFALSNNAKDAMVRDRRLCKYDFSEPVSATLRAEYFDDNDGARTLTARRSRRSPLPVNRVGN